MIEILGSKVSFFTLYGLISLQLIVIGCVVGAIKLGRTMADGVPLAVPCWAVAGVVEMLLLMWMGAL